MTMRRSPRRPLILKRRKLPFLQNEPSPDFQSGKGAATQAIARQCIPDGVCIMDHPSMSATQVVVIPKTADLHSVIGALTAKGKECGAQGPNKFILLSGNNSGGNGSFCYTASEENNFSSQSTNTQSNSQDVQHFTAVKPLSKDLECGPLDDSLTNIHWLGRMSTSSLEHHPTKPKAEKENQHVNSLMLQSCKTETAAEATLKQPMSERPPYSYMAMIQFAINSKQNRRMTLKEIYMWIEDHFPYFREVAKPGWKNSIRHNLSLHDMFIRETSADGKMSFWTIRPEANRRLTLDQVYKPSFDPVKVPGPTTMLFLPNQQEKRMLPNTKKTPFGTERKMKPLLPRADAYFVPFQLPVASPVYMPVSTSCSQKKRTISRGAKKVRIAPKVTRHNVPGSVTNRENLMDIKEEPVEVPIKCKTPNAPPRQTASSSRRKQRLVHSLHEEPVLLCPNNTFFDSGVMSDASTFQDMQDMEQNIYEKLSPNRSFKTPIKSTDHLTSSTPSKPSCNVFPDQWKVTPVRKQSHTVLDFSPIRTPGGPAVTPHDYSAFSFSSTPFKELPLFSSPRELLTSAPSRLPDSPVRCPRSSCSRELLQAGEATPNNRSVTEGLVLDTMNDSLSKILVDISFSGLDDEDLGMANISWSEFIPHLK